MASFQFVIPANSFSSGNPSSSTTIVADRGLSRTIKHRTLTAKFGDGYEQRVIDGVNSKGDTFAISINNRLATEVNLIAKFLDVKAGNNFDFIVTDYDGDTTLKVVCDDYNIIYTREDYHSLTANFRRVYEP
jgi:phage-related protein